MGKPSIKSKNLKEKKINENDKRQGRIADLQIQLHDFKKLVVDSGEQVMSEINKCSRENNNLVEWLKLYDEITKRKFTI